MTLDESPRLTFPTLDSYYCFFRSDLKVQNWQTEIEGLAAIVRLVKYHPETILSDLNEIIADLNEECKNLRSQVSFAKLHSIAKYSQSLQLSTFLLSYDRLREPPFKLLSLCSRFWEKTWRPLRHSTPLFNCFSLKPQTRTGNQPAFLLLNWLNKGHNLATLVVLGIRLSW